MQNGSTASATSPTTPSATGAGAGGTTPRPVITGYSGGVLYTCGWKGCIALNSDWKTFRNHVQGHTKRNSTRLNCQWHNCPESNRHYQHNEKYLLALHVSKHVEDVVREQDQLHSTNYALFLGKKRPSLPEGSSDILVFGGGGGGGSNSGSIGSRPRHQISHPQQTQFQKSFKVRGDNDALRGLKDDLTLTMAVQQFSRPVGPQQIPANATPAQVLDEVQKALNSPTVSAAEERDATVTTEEFLNLSLSKAIYYLELQHANSLETPHRSWLSSVAEKLSHESGLSPLSAQIEKELDHVALIFHNHLPASTDCFKVSQHLKERSLHERQIHSEVISKYKRPNALFKDQVQFESVFDEFYSAAKDIAERSSKKRRVSISSSGDLTLNTSEVDMD